VVLGPGNSSVEMWEGYLIHSTEFRTAYHETMSRRFYEGRQTQNTLCCRWGKNVLTGRYYTSFALLVSILEVYVDCATTHLALEQEMPDRFPHLQIVHKAYPSSPEHSLVHDTSWQRR
jgi:hypothetical protein